MKRIVLIEDNPDNRLLMQVMLGRTHDLVAFESGAAALAGMGKAPPDLVLLDISLPEMDGTEVLRRLRADARLGQIPVIALTAHAMTGDREKYLALGFDGYISKPILDEELLLEAISGVLERKAST